MTGRTLQRTLVLTFGPLASAAGGELHGLLAPVEQPGAAVIVLASDEATGQDREAQLGVAIEAVSYAGLRRELARAGWTLDRLDELGVVVIADATAARPAVGAALDSVRAIARVRLGVGIGALLLALCPEPGGDCEPLRQLLAEPAFDRGTVILSRARLDGFRLESEAALATAAAAAAHALIVTPLRDAPAGALAERFPENWDRVLLPRPEAAFDTVDSPVSLTLGVARWAWSPGAARSALAGGWMLAAFDRWLAETGADPSGLAGQAFSWLEQQGAALEALVIQAADLVDTPDVSPWHAPRPWEMSAVIARLRSIAAADSDSQAAGDGNLSDRATGWAGAARLACRNVLEESPAGGLVRAQRWVAALRACSAKLVEHVAARQERESGVAAGLDRRVSELGERVDALLNGWPGEESTAWLPVAWRLWRWPGLALRYVALNRTGRAFHALAEERVALVREKAITVLLRDAYRHWEVEASRLAGHLDEVGEMLRFVRAGLAVEPGETGLPALYEVVTADPVEEATRAASAIGGLGRQLDALDDGFVEDLKVAAWERFDALETLDAVAVLPYFYPTAHAAADWWQAIHDDAAPLWPATETSPAYEETSTLIFSPNPAGLRAWLGEGESGNVRWLPGPDKETIIVARLRPTPVLAQRHAPAGENGGRNELESD